MPKKKKRGKGQPSNEELLNRARLAIAAIALCEGISEEEVRTQMKLAMLSGLASNDPQVQAEWKRIPCEGEVPTPEEFIAYCAKQLSK